MRGRDYIAVLIAFLNRVLDAALGVYGTLLPYAIVVVAVVFGVLGVAALAPVAAWVHRYVSIYLGLPV